MQATALIMTLLCLSYVLISMHGYLNSVVSKLHNLQNLTQAKKKKKRERERESVRERKRKKEIHDLSPRNFVYLPDLRFPMFSSTELTWLIPE
jgi:hypothetical protein